MNYPFEFNELLLTDKVLDILGFSEYWAGCGDFGSRRLDLKENTSYLIFDIDETCDPESGYGYGKPEYCPQHFTNKDFRPMYFLHEMYEDILRRRTQEEVEKFIELTKSKGVNMYPYIESYLEWKKQKQNT